jgi:epoxyqueuosine reductase
MHACCAPCSIYTLKSLRTEGMDVVGYFFNPNIHPFTEFRKRLETLEHFAATSRLPLVVDKEYDIESYLQRILDKGEERCLSCYGMRLERAFQRAADSNVDGVTTTLLYSKYQRHDAIKKIGEELADRFRVRFIYRDFRIGWKEGIEESRKLNMYRQQYCGCILSERDRYMDPP